MIKKSIVGTLVFSCFFFCSFVYAEGDLQGEEIEQARRNVNFGGKLGGNFAIQATEGPLGNNLDSKHKIGIPLGVFASVDVYDVLVAAQEVVVSLQPEILFSPKGVNIERDGAKVGAYHLRYIEVPILARMRMPVTPDIAPYLILGPNLGILVTAEIENSRGDRTDTKESLKAIDLGLIFGAGVSLDVSALKGTLLLEARYDLGLRDINANDEGGHVKNRAFSLLLGYQY